MRELPRKMNCSRRLVGAVMLGEPLSEGRDRKPSAVN